MRSEIKWKKANLFNPFLVPIYTTWKHQIAIGFLLFPGGIKWGINPKWVKWKPKFIFCFHDAFNILHDRTICYITLSQMWNGSTALHCFLLVQPISCYWFLSLQHENIRKPEVFLCFQGVQKETCGMIWVEKEQIFSESTINAVQRSREHWLKLAQ